MGHSKPGLQFLLTSVLIPIQEVLRKKWSSYMTISNPIQSQNCILLSSSNKSQVGKGDNLTMIAMRTKKNNNYQSYHFQVHTNLLLNLI